MDLKPLVSVIIPMYNVKGYIVETINSVLNQTYKNLEIIIIDDGSIDGSKELVQKIMVNNNNILYYYQTNKGVSAARNTGLKYSTGELIAFLDSDDLWAKDKIEKQIDKIIKVDADACYCGTIDYFEDRKAYVKEAIQYFDGKILIPFLKDKFWGQTGTWIIRKNLIKENNILFNESCNWGEDFEFFFKVMALGKVTYVEDYLFIYRRRGNSLSKFSFSKFQEIEVWLRLRDWVVMEDKLTDNKDIVIKIINEFRLPSSTIKIIYESLNDKFENHNNDRLEYYFKKYELSTYIDELKFGVGATSTTLKIYFYKYAIKYKVLFKVLTYLKNIKFLLKRSKK